ncbi:MAG: calcium/sodium antiporter [Cellvibrio sp.]
MLIDWGLVALGLVLLTFGGDWVVKGALAVATRFGVSPLLAGLVIVGFGTSSPELVISLQAALKGSPDIAIGNIVGSNITNILLILGVCCIITTMGATKLSITRDGVTMIVASIMFILLAMDGFLQWYDGLIFLITIGGYLAWAYCTERVTERDVQSSITAPDVEPLFKTLAILLAGFAALIVGAEVFLRGAISIAEKFGISQAVIGLTLVAVGTSLPELAATIMAAVRRETDLAIGNIIGSNIFNILCILGLSSLVTQLPLAGRIVQIDQWVMLAVAIGLVVFMMMGRKVGRWKGIIMVLAYCAYVSTMI